MFEHPLEPQLGRFDVEIRVGVGAVEYPQVGRDVLNALGKKNGDGLSRRGGSLKDQGRAVFGERFQLSERVASARVVNRDFIGALNQSALFEVIDNIYSHTTSTG